MGVIRLKKGLESLDRKGSDVLIFPTNDNYVINASGKFTSSRVYIDFLSIVYSEGERLLKELNGIYWHCLASEKGAKQETLTEDLINIISEYGLPVTSGSKVFNDYVKSNFVPMLKKRLIEYIIFIVFDKVKNVNYLFISLDGKVPYGKVKEQRQRRFNAPLAPSLGRSDLERYATYGIYSADEKLRAEYDETKYVFMISQCISAVKTVEFMHDVGESIKEKLKSVHNLTNVELTERNIKERIDPTDTGKIYEYVHSGKKIMEMLFSKKFYGEGEQIIVREIINDVERMEKAEKDSTNFVFYSPDGDVIFLSLFLSVKLGIQINTIKSANKYPSNFMPSIYVDQVRLKDTIVSLFLLYLTNIIPFIMNPSVRIYLDEQMSKHVLMDFIYIVSMFGNDFLYTIPSLNIMSCIRNMVYIYAYYHATNIRDNKRFIFSPLYIENDRKRDKVKEYIPVFKNIVKFYTILSKFEPALVMDSYLAEGTKKSSYDDAVKIFGSIFTFYHMFIYCRHANVVYDNILEKGQNLNFEDSSYRASIMKDVASDVPYDLNKYILFMEKGDTFDLSLNMYRYGTNGEIVQILDTDKFIKLFTQIERGIDVYPVLAENGYYLDLYNIRSVPTFYSFLPTDYIYVYAVVSLKHIKSIVQEYQNKEKKDMNEQRVVFFKLSRRIYVSLINRRWDIVTGSHEGFIKRLHELCEILSNRTTPEKVLSVIDSILDICTRVQGVVQSVNFIKIKLEVSGPPLIETDVDNDILTNFRNEYSSLLNGTAFDLGNSENNYPSRNVLIKANTRLYKYDRNAEYHKGQEYVKEDDNKKQRSQHGGFPKLDNTRSIDGPHNVIKIYRQQRYNAMNLEEFKNVRDRYTSKYLHIKEPTDINRICEEYVSGMSWVFDYYVNYNSEYTDRTSVSTWVYSSSRPPMLCHIAEYLTSLKGSMVYLGDQYCKTLVDSNSYFTDLERKIFIFPREKVEYKTPEEIEVYNIISRILKTVELISGYLRKTNNHVSISKVYSSGGKLPGLVDYIKGIVGGEVDIEEYMIKNIYDSIIDVRCPDPTYDTDAKLKSFAKTISQLQSVNMLVEFIRNDAIEKKRIESMSDLEKTEYEDFFGTIDCKAVPFFSKCHLTDKMFKTPKYADLRFMLDVVANMLCMKVYSSKKVVPDKIDYEYEQEVEVSVNKSRKHGKNRKKITTTEKQVKKFSSSKYSVKFIDLTRLDDGESFKFRWIRDVFVEQILRYLNTNNKTKDMEELLLSIHNTVTKNIESYVKDNIENLKTALDKESEQRCTAILVKNIESIKLAYVDEFIRVMSTESQKVVDLIKQEIAENIVLLGYDREKYEVKIDMFKNDIAITLFRNLYPALRFETISVDRIYTDSKLADVGNCKK